MASPARGQGKLSGVAVGQPVAYASPRAQAMPEVNARNVPRRHDEELLTVWKGTTWLNSCPCCCACLTPLCCLTWKWHISNKRIDVSHGCCGGKIDAVDLRRVVDIHFNANCFELCINRGTITIRSDDPSVPELKLNTCGAKRLFKDLRVAWSESRMATAVNVDV